MYELIILKHYFIIQYSTNHYFYSSGRFLYTYINFFYIHIVSFFLFLLSIGFDIFEDPFSVATLYSFGNIKHVNHYTFLYLKNVCQER